MVLLCVWLSVCILHACMQLTDIGPTFAGELAPASPTAYIGSLVISMHACLLHCSSWLCHRAATMVFLGRARFLTISRLINSSRSLLGIRTAVVVQTGWDIVYPVESIKRTACTAAQLCLFLRQLHVWWLRLG